MTSVLLFSQLPSNPVIPEWIQLLPASPFTGADGRGPFHVDDMDALRRAIASLGKIPVDENHSTVLGPQNGAPSPARGWIVETEERGGGLWGRVQWTATGRDLMEDATYRGVSPVVETTQDRRVINVTSVALTNAPNLTMASLHAKDGSMSLHDKILATLGLPKDASEEAVLKAVSDNSAFVTALAKEVGVPDGATAQDVVQALHAKGADTKDAVDPQLLAEAEKLAGVQPGAGVGAVFRELHAMAARLDKGVGDKDKTIIELQSRLSVLENDTRRRDGERLLDDAIRDGKPLKPVRDSWVERFCRDPEGVKADIAALPSIHNGGIVKPPADDGTPALTDEDKRIAEAFGQDPKAFAAHKKTMKEVL